MRFVFDTNVLLSAHVSVGLSKQILDHCVQEHQVLLSEFILDEFHDKARSKFKWPKEQADFAVWNLRAHIILVAPKLLAKPICRDQDDDMVLATAIAADCHALVTGDKDLLTLEKHAGIAIVSPNQVLAFIGAVKKLKPKRIR